MSVVAQTARATLTDKVAEALVGLIRERGLREGDLLPATANLSDQFGVSRTVIREALAELAGRGLLRRQQGREGTFTVPGGEHLGRLLAYRMAFEDITFEQLQDFREVIEVGAARLAAAHASGVHIATLSDALAELMRVEEEEAMLDADLKFHRAVATASGNPLFGLQLDGLTPLLMESRRAAWQGYRASGGAMDVVHLRHAAIRDAIAEHDADAAAAAMIADLQDTRSSLDRLSRRQRRAGSR